MTKISEGIHTVHLARGTGYKVTQPVEETNKSIGRRSAFSLRDLPVNHQIEKGDFRFVRPCSGIPANHKDKLIGQRLVRPVSAFNPITFRRYWKMTNIAIMQPTFLPWLGYFAMIDHVDTFVFLDDVQYIKRSWQCRNQIKSAQGILTLTVPCKQEKTPICNIKIDNPFFYRKLVRSIEQSYSKAPFRMGIVAVWKNFCAETHKSWKSQSCINQ